MPRISIDWMDHCGNLPRIQLHGLLHESRPKDARWEQRGGLHRCDHLPIVSYFYNDMSGNPCSGFGGATFEGIYLDGSKFSFQGAWSSRAARINAMWPDRPIVDVDFYEQRIASAVTADFLIDLWRKQKAECDFGFAWCDDGDMVLRPTRNGILKNHGEIVSHVE